MTDTVTAPAPDLDSVSNPGANTCSLGKMYRCRQLAGRRRSSSHTAERESAESVDVEDCAAATPSEKYACGLFGGNPFGGVKTDEDLAAAESEREEGFTGFNDV